MSEVSYPIIHGVFTPNDPAESRLKIKLNAEGTPIPFEPDELRLAAILMVDLNASADFLAIAQALQDGPVLIVPGKWSQTSAGTMVVPAQEGATNG